MPHSFFDTARIPFSLPTCVHKTVCNMRALYARGRGSLYADKKLKNQIILIQLLISPAMAPRPDIYKCGLLYVLQIW